MKKIFFLIIFCSGVTFQAVSQSKSPLVASLKYNVLYTPGNKLVIRDVCQLDISKTDSYYYSLGELEDKKKLTEQLKRAIATGTILKRSSADRNHYVCPFKIYKKFDTKKAYRIEYIGNQNLGVVVDELNPSKWKILNETKVINKFNCRKAVMKKDTAVVTAWFSADIPVNDGPNIYYGLPGAIIEATSNTGYVIKLISVTYNKDPKNILNVPPYIVATKAQMEKAIQNSNAAFSSGEMPGIKVEKTSDAN